MITSTAVPTPHAGARVWHLDFGWWRGFLAKQGHLLAGALLMAGSGAFILILPAELPLPGRIALAVFTAAVIAWSVLRWPDAPVALGSVIALALLGVAAPGALFAGLGEPLIWLLVGAFIMAVVVRETGLAIRLTRAMIAGAATPVDLFYRLTGAIFLTAFLVPSTSGRAAMLLPVFTALAAGLPSRRVVVALALLFPTVILLSACASLMGAGAHLVALEFMPAPYTLDFLGWAVLGAPFAVVTCLLATWLILHLFLDARERALPLTTVALTAAPATGSQRYTGVVLLACVAMWATTRWHGIDAALVAMGGALMLTWQRVTGVSFKQAVQKVEWNLILFLAGTAILGEALVTTGAAQILARGAAEALPAPLLREPAAVALIVALVSLLAHLVIVSRSARAAVLLPTLAVPLALFPEQAGNLIFVSVLASGYCQTFKISAKPVALFAQSDISYADADLLRLSVWLMPIMLVVLGVFACLVWPALGLPLFRPA